MVILRFPHLVLADVGDDDGLAIGFLPQIVDDVSGVEVAVVRKSLDVADGGIALEFADVAKPVAALAMFKAREKLLQDLAGVADQRGVHLHVFVDFGTINLDVNLAGVLGVGAEIAGDAIVKTHADSNEQVGFLDGMIDPCFSVHAHHAEIERIAGREAPDAEQGHGDGKIAGVNELIEYADGAGNHDAVPGEDERTLGGVEQLDGALKFGLIVVDALALGGKLRNAGLPIEIAGSLLGVLGDIDEYGTGASGIGDYKSFADGARDVLGARDDHVVLGDRHGDAGDIDFLKGVGTKELAADLAGDADDGRGIQHGGGDAGDHVGGAGSGSGHGNAHAAAGASIAIGHVGRALFVAHENVMQLGFAERVIDREDGAAGVAKKVAHAQFSERFAKYFCTGELHEVLEALCAAIEKELGTAVIAPMEADETSRAYLAITPEVKRGCGGFQLERRRWISASVS